MRGAGTVAAKQVKKSAVVLARTGLAAVEAMEACKESDGLVAQRAAAGRTYATVCRSDEWAADDDNEGE